VVERQTLDQEVRGSSSNLGLSSSLYFDDSTGCSRKEINTICENLFPPPSPEGWMDWERERARAREREREREVSL
jgi:hypothetical protein